MKKNGDGEGGEGEKVGERYAKNQFKTCEAKRNGCVS